MKRTYVKTIKELAQALGASYVTLQKHLKNPGAPPKSQKGYCVELCRSWWASTEDLANPRKPRKPQPAGKPSGDPDPEDDEDDEEIEALIAKHDENSKVLQELKKRELAEKIKKLEISNAKESEQLIEIGVAVDLWGEFAEAVRKVIENSGLDDIEKDRCFEALVRATRKLHEKHARAERNALKKAREAQPA